MRGAGLAGVLGALLAFSIALFSLRPAWFPSPITSFGLQFDRQFQATLLISAILFFLLHLALIVLLLSKRKSVPLRHKAWLTETIWTGLAAAVLLSLAFQGSRIWAAVHPQAEPPDTIRIEVYAHQFAWAFRYPGPDRIFGRTSPRHINDVLENPQGVDPSDAAGQDDVRSPVLKVPLGREIVLLLHSRDVIHDFFVPELRFKQDVVPGMEIPYRFRPDRTGTFEIACSELCGIGHSQMRATLEVLTADDFDKWLRDRSLAATTK